FLPGLEKDVFIRADAPDVGGTIEGSGAGEALQLAGLEIDDPARGPRFGVVDFVILVIFAGDSDGERLEPEVEILGHEDRRGGVFLGDPAGADEDMVVIALLTAENFE